MRANNFYCQVDVHGSEAVDSIFHGSSMAGRAADSSVWPKIRQAALDR
jgi:hypothetical protein